MPSHIATIHANNGSFLGGYSGYDSNTLWNTVAQGYLKTNGHFLANNSNYGFDQNGSPYMALIDKSTMKIVSTDGESLINDMSSVINKCKQMAQ